MAEYNDRSSQVSAYNAAQIAFQEGNSLVEDGAWQRGLESLRQALDLFRKAENDVGKAATFLAIGDVHMRFGDYEVARGAFGDAERLFRLMHLEAGEALAQMKIGLAELYLQHVDDAFKYLQAASDYLIPPQNSGVKFVRL